MWARVRMGWVAIRDSLWFIPTLLTLASAALAALLVALETRGTLDLGHARHWLLGGGAEGARGVLSAIAGGLITVTGVVFSVTIVALQLASSQFTPRLLRGFTADRSNQVVLGVFIATFTYCLLVLRTIRSASEQEGAFVPRVAVTVAVALVLVSIAFLIYFIHHAARSMQVSVILDRVTRQSLEQVDLLFPEAVGEEDAAHPAPLEFPQAAPHVVTAPRGGYLQAVDGNGLFRLGERHDLVIRMEAHVGAHLLPGQPLASVWPADAVDDDVEAHVRRALVVGLERTPEQDVEFGIVELADIAVRALSPGINDPTTAFLCIDSLAEVLLALGSRPVPRPVRTERGRVHFIARHTAFERAVGLAYDQVRHFGQDNVAIQRKLLETAERLIALLPERSRGPLRRMAAELRAERTRLGGEEARDPPAAPG